MNPENFDQPTFAEILQGYEAEVARLTSELAAARDELEQRREHMRRGMPMGVAVSAARRAGEGEA